MTKAVIFDLGRVIVPFDLNRAYSGIESLCGIPAAEVPKRIKPTGLVERFESGQIEPRVFFDQLSAHLRLEATYEELCEVWSSIFLPETLLPENLLSGLARKYPLVLLSNTNQTHFEWIVERYPLLRHFHSFVLSYQVGAMKPSPVIYRRAIEAAGVEAGECFFTDDIPEYVEGARGEGIDAVRFQSAPQIMEELRVRGVEWDV
ncbi:MAG TPA: HAD family phosphatase [Bryobacteraceae bacterium]|nr:HAD family phosphatase [Bryobacteraceae bacterium]